MQNAEQSGAVEVKVKVKVTARPAFQRTTAALGRAGGHTLRCKRFARWCIRLIRSQTFR